MYRATALLLVLGLLLIRGRPATAQAITLSTSASPGTMTVSTASIPGQQPDPVTDATTSYHLKLHTGTMKLTAQLDVAMPAGVTLQATFNAAGGASTSNGAVTLDATARDMVINISNVNTTQGITYVLSATAAAGVVPLQSRTVTITLANYP